MTVGLRIAQQPKSLPYWDSKDENVAEFKRRREKKGKVSRLGRENRMEKDQDKKSERNGYKYKGREVNRERNFS